jgi:hypothetical protein
MEFRWAAIIALWTLLVGPVFDVATKPAKARSRYGQAVSVVAPKPPLHRQ